jgi:hypothetical protein
MTKKIDAFVMMMTWQLMEKHHVASFLTTLIVSNV